MYKKKGFPEKGELIICTIKRITPHAAFVELDEYENKEGMLHVSEMPRKWVRAMKTYLKEGTKLVCLVMDVEPEKNFINLSVRRVGASQKRTKQQEWANEKKAHDILEVFAKQIKSNIRSVYSKIGNKLLEKYGLLYPIFLEVSKVGAKPLLEAGVDKKLAEELTKLVQKRITLPKAELEELCIVSTMASNGLEIIKQLFSQLRELAKKQKVDFEVHYLGAPKYKIKISSTDFKLVDKVKTQIEEFAADFMRKHKGVAEFGKRN